MQAARTLIATALLAITGLLGLASIAPAQTADPKLLVGKWEGEIQRSQSRQSNDRTVVIESVGPGEGSLPVKGRYGIPGQKLTPMDGAMVEMVDGKPVLKFKTNVGSNVVLRLRGDKDMEGTIDFPGAGTRAQDHPIRLKKVD